VDGARGLLCTITMQTIIMVIDITCRYIEIPVHGILHTTKSAKAVIMKIIDIPHKMIGVYWHPVKFPQFKIRVCPNKARAHTKQDTEVSF